MVTALESSRVSVCVYVQMKLLAVEQRWGASERALQRAQSEMVAKEQLLLDARQQLEIARYLSNLTLAGDTFAISLSDAVMQLSAKRV